jgi:hypothetical protein
MRLALIVLLVASASAQPAKRALLVGIDDYTACSLPGSLPMVSAVHQHSGCPDLRGAANDVRILTELLVLRYGFERTNIVTLTNQEATRAAILHALEEHLVRRAHQGDIVFYYFAGHGAQVPNAGSDEPDRLDESIVPADSRRGAADIRDKELRPLFNRILQRGAYLTLLLDHCHSGSGFRGLPNGARRRGIAPAPPIVDAKRYGPRPDERGALILASAQDSDPAWETRGDDGLMHGAFTWAWIHAMRDAVPGEPAQEIFLRAQARLRGETPYQEPVMLGNADARLRPFLGGDRLLGMDRRASRTLIAVETLEPDGQIVLQGGWAHGLSVDSELSPLGDRRTRLRVTRLLGLGRSIARISSGPAVPAGALLEVVRWPASPEHPLRVFVPRMAADVPALASRFAAASKAKWILDPLEISPGHILRPRGEGWELMDRDGGSIALASDQAAIDAIARLGASDSLFVQLPPTETIVADGNAQSTLRAGVHAVDSAADYILAGRFHRNGHGNRIEYAWIRPLMRNTDRLAGGLPPRTAWTSDPGRLSQDLATLRRIHDWLSLISPPGTPAPYRLAVRDERTKQLVRDGVVVGNHVYSLVLRSTAQHPEHPRWYYIFVIDRHGNSQLVFPTTGSVENRYPLADPAPDEIPLGNPSAFRVTRPYGFDTFVLLSTEEPLPDPSILGWDGVRARRALGETPWSIERITFESVAAPRRRARRPDRCERRILARRSRNQKKRQEASGLARTTRTADR